MTKSEAFKALRMILGAIEDTVKETGVLGAPASSLYLAMQEHGATMEQFEFIMSALVAAGRVKKRGHCYFEA